MMSGPLPHGSCSNNEREVYEQSISAVCQLDWPKDRLLIQVLDDSDDESIHCEYVEAYEFVAIFDADFQPNPDFLKKTVPHFKDNPEIGMEIKALEESGGWLERTTVEDMDIAVRAHLNGWKFIFLNDVKVLCEVPESNNIDGIQDRCTSSACNFQDSYMEESKLNTTIPFILPFYSFTLFCIILPFPVWVIFKKVNKIYRKELTLAFLLLTRSTFLFPPLPRGDLCLDLIGEQMS
ncbi:hypothetical protein GQ457_15G023400 [Hibiscus cannabinus]